MENWILYAVDGTGSKEWRIANKGFSHVHEFYSSFCNGKVTIKRFVDGPSLIGSECQKMVHAGICFILDSINFIKRKYKKSDVNIVLVGHSRGGAIVACIAENLYNQYKIKTYFIGLYDAVDRSTSISPKEDIELYSSHIYHAMRHPSWGSRDSFGNCCMGKKVVKRYFYTSHDGIGGAISLDDGSNINIRPGHPVEDRMQQLITGKTRFQIASVHSKAAHIWMKQNAINTFTIKA